MISTILSALAGRVWWIAGAVIILAGGYVYIRILQADLDAASLRATLAEAGQTEATRVANANAGTIDTIKEQAAKDAEALTAERDAALIRAAAYAILQGDITNAPSQTLCTPGNDDPVAPVLARTLDGLRRDPTAANGGHGSAG